MEQCLSETFFSGLVKTGHIGQCVVINHQLSYVLLKIDLQLKLKLSKLSQ